MGGRAKKNWHVLGIYSLKMTPLQALISRKLLMHLQNKKLEKKMYTNCEHLVMLTYTFENCIIYY